MDKKLQQLALDFYKLGAVKFSKEGFKFNLHAEHPEVPLSPNYLNLRDVFRMPAIRKEIAKRIAVIVKKIKPQVLVDLPQSISPINTAVSDLTGVPMVTLRSEALKGAKKDHGVAQNINGIYKKGQRALIIDDVVSSQAFTKIKAIEVLNDSGLKLIKKIVIVVDRNEGGKETLKKYGFDLVNLMDFKGMLEFYLAKKMITKNDFDKSIEFSKISKEIVLK